MSPIKPETIGGALEFFNRKVKESEKKLDPKLFQSQGLLARAPGGMQHLSYMKGMCDALWKNHQTDKAADMANKMLWLDPTDQIEIREMLVDFVLELQRYEEVLPLLIKEDPNSPLVLWTNALVDFEKYGADHDQTNKALMQAIKYLKCSIS